MAERRVLRVLAEGDVTSFRYPHFLQGVQPTFPMPPPATIYGLLAGALGDLPDPGGLAFAYRFTSQAQFRDYEHTHIVTAKETKLNPFERLLLFRPSLTLYLDAPGELDRWAEAFRSPRYTVCLGRSQDLMTYRAIDETGLVRAEQGYIEHTLLPMAIAARVGGVSTATMPRYLSPAREADWAQYGILRETRIWPPDPDDDDDPGLVVEGDDFELWSDPDSPEHDDHPGYRRALVFHRFVE